MMQINDLMYANENELEEPQKAYEQLPDEPDRWYDRFYRYCQMGPTRSITGCYNEYMAARTEDQTQAATKTGPGSGALTTRKRQAPGKWKEKARIFKWSSRASAWDADQRKQMFRRMEGTLNLFCEAGHDALVHLINVMNNQVVEPDGTITRAQNQYERRIAAKTIFSNWVDVLALLKADKEEERQEIKIREIRVNLRDREPEADEEAEA